MEKASILADLSNAVYLEGRPLIEGFSQHSDQPKTFKFLNKGSAQGALMKLSDNEAVIVFRGTQPNQFNDVLADLQAWFSKSETSGEVHSGFKKELDKLYPEVWQWVRGKSVHKERTTVYVTGHSLGAAMATLCAARLKEAGYNVILYTYGSPRIGNKIWASNFENIEHYRFVHNNDIVTTVPPEVGGYTHVGKLCYISYSGEIEESTKWARFRDKLKGRFRALCKFQLFDGLYDHSMDLYTYKIKDNKDSLN